jgi:hypothetical protein
VTGLLFSDRRIRTGLDHHHHPHFIATSGSDRHPILRPTNRADAHVDGMASAISQAELAAADEYKVDDYRRISVPLPSGATAWVYVLAG